MGRKSASYLGLLAAPSRGLTLPRPYLPPERAQAEGCEKTLVPLVSLEPGPAAGVAAVLVWVSKEGGDVELLEEKRRVVR